MAKKISRVLASQRDFTPRPFALLGHTHPADYPPSAVDIAARDAITGDQRYEGVIVYVQSDQTTYQLRGGTLNTDWVTLVTATGVASHTELGDIGAYTHAQVDTHIDNATIHFTQASISITESQISDLQAYALAAHNHDAEYLGLTGTAVSTNALESTTTTINVSAAIAPISGQVLTATGSATATWQTPANAGSGNIVQTGTPLATHVGYFTADKNLSGDAGFTWVTASARLNIIGAAPVMRLQDSGDAAALMTAGLEFYDSTVLVGHLSYAGTGVLTLENTAGDIVFDTDGTATVSVTGDGDMSIGGYISGYGGTPANGALLTWVTANSRAEFIVAPTGIVPDGTPVDNQVVVFTSATNAEGDATFTWDASILTAGTIIYDNSVAQLTLGDGTLVTPGIEINGSATATPFINLQQAGVTQAVFRYNNTSSRTEISSLDNDITFRPGNVDTLTLTGASLDMSGNITLTGTVDGRDVAADGTTQDSHIADGTLHFTQAAISIPLSQINDVTATVGEVNLLDLAGLTVGWVLSADSATTASWKAPATGAGTGDVIKVGVPVDSQIGVWTGDGTIEGTSGLTYDGATGVFFADGALLLSERADHASTPAATFAELWVRNGTTQALMFTDDTGLDTPLSIGRNLIAITYITATNASWAPNSDTKFMVIKAVGGGGGGGGINGGGADAAAGSGGGGAGVCIKNVTTIDPTYNITIGTGGAGGVAAAAAAAGVATTVVGSVGPGTNCNMSAGGGGFGTGYLANQNGAASGATGGTSSGGDLNLAGNSSASSSVISGRIAGYSVSGTAPGYGGSLGPVNETTGTAATMPGAGGGAVTGRNTAGNHTGGAGFRGEVVIYEYS